MNYYVCSGIYYANVLCVIDGKTYKERWKQLIQREMKTIKVEDEIEIERRVGRTRRGRHWLTILWTSQILFLCSKCTTDENLALQHLTAVLFKDWEVPIFFEKLLILTTLKHDPLDHAQPVKIPYISCISFGFKSCLQIVLECPSHFSPPGWAWQGNW